MHYTYKLNKIGGKLTYRCFAVRQGTTFEFYRRNENGKKCRNVYNNGYGNTVRIPGFYYGYYKEKWETENWCSINDNIQANKCWKLITEKDIIKYDREYPGIRYMLRKASFTHEDVWRILPIWKKNPKVEFLIANGYHSIAFNKSFWKMKESTQKEYLQAIKKTSWKNPTLEMVRCIKNGMTEDEYNLSHSWEFYDYMTKKYVYEVEVLRYLIKKKVNVTEYYDYIKMAKSLGKDTSDPYWKFPNDFRKAHQTVLAKCDHKRYLSELKAKKAEERRLKTMESRYKKAVKNYVNKVTVHDGIKVYVPGKITDFDLQADVLHQCIVENAYYENVADKKSILVFITKQDVPYATCELLKKGRKFKIGQFYGDEDLEDYEAQPDAVNAFNKWAKDNKIHIAS